MTTDLPEYALTVRLPWAAAIRDGVKLVENRPPAPRTTSAGSTTTASTGAGWASGGSTPDRRHLP